MTDAAIDPALQPPPCLATELPPCLAALVEAACPADPEGLTRAVARRLRAWRAHRLSAEDASEAWRVNEVMLVARAERFSSASPCEDRAWSTSVEEDLAHLFTAAAAQVGPQVVEHQQADFYLSFLVEAARRFHCVSTVGEYLCTRERYEAAARGDTRLRTLFTAIGSAAQTLATVPLALSLRFPSEVARRIRTALGGRLHQVPRCCLGAAWVVPTWPAEITQDLALELESREPGWARVGDRQRRIGVPVLCLLEGGASLLEAARALGRVVPDQGPGIHAQEASMSAAYCGALALVLAYREAHGEVLARARLRWPGEDEGLITIEHGSGFTLTRGRLPVRGTLRLRASLARPGAAPEVRRYCVELDETGHIATVNDEAAA